VRIAVVGGGLAGLATAYRLQQASLDVTVVEAADAPGGALRSVEVAGITLPAGADAFWGRKPGATELCRELGLELVAPASSGTYLWTDAGLVAYPSDAVFAIPGDPGDVLRWPGISKAGRRRALADLLRAKRKDEGDQTLDALLRRRLGDEATDMAVAPLLTAPTLGDADRMSLRATYPDLERWEDWQGSLIRGAQAARRALRKGPDAAPILVRPRGGVEALPRALAERLGLIVRTGAVVARLEPGPPWRVTTEASDVLEADVVVLATPSAVARRLLTGEVGVASAALDELATASAVTALLVYPEGTQGALPDGTGFIVPRGRAPMRSCAWLSSRWPDPSFGTRAIVSCALGGVGDEDVLDAPEEDVVQACGRHLAAVLPLPAEPEHAVVVRWPGALPVYDLGHLERVARIRELLPPGIFVVGQAYDGTDVADVVRAAGEVADAVIRGAMS
jgi:oxygen-dependent protoporphyrinogen oxidase